MKVWDATSGDIFTNLQPQEPGINDVLHWKDSGLLMLGMDAPRIQARPSAHHPAAHAETPAMMVFCLHMIT